MALDPSEGVRRVEVDFAFDGEIEVDLAFEFAPVDLAFEVDFELEFATRFVLEAGRLRPPLGSGGKDFSLLNLIPKPELEPPTGVVALNSAS